MTAHEALIVVYGATGDLMKRKLLPALYRLSASGALAPKTRILGVARDATLSEVAFRDSCIEALVDAGAASARRIRTWCRDTLRYQPVPGDASAYALLATRIAAIERDESLVGNRVFYLALPPAALPSTIEALASCGLHRSPKGGWTRIIIEKPFGRDLASAQTLNAMIHRSFDETQVYRIDHYLGKEMVQNLLAFRFGNALFESAWNRNHIESVRITVAETLGVEARAAYYEQAGALRDMVQNHMTQLLCLTAMDVPSQFSADPIRFEKVKVLAAARAIVDTDVVRGQYAEGTIDGRLVAAYRDEPGVARRSPVETFVSLRVALDNWRWQGVPFILSTGKRLARRATEIAIVFRRPPVALFRSMADTTPATNVLTISLQPNEGFALTFEVKAEGEPFRLRTETMRFGFPARAGAESGYETLLLDIVEGDPMLFVHADEAEASWRLFGPLLERRITLHRYDAGSDGPKAATIATAALLASSGIR